ncbi:hypothetical protein Lal_00047251 [Lupinus albus]|uniref:Uncharacterized protein n=1 Tax=Lupinus albus TaxID=3870 RepID=A0A6A5N671_LUPAL|nr:hypothetical protein Lalb_Chr02g0147911 [Lupinus albus]KAF1878582.1 hypothetical protein Lal_00047251 [Lupinus albus]
MNEVQREGRNPQLFYGVNNSNIRNAVNERSISDNKLWLGKSINNRPSPSYNYEPPRRIEQCDGNNGRYMERVRNNNNKNNDNDIKSSAPNTSWWNDSDTKRKRRVAKYKVYSSESKLKCSLKKGFRSFKNMVYNL